MVSRSTAARRGPSPETEVCQIKLVDEQDNDADKIICADPVFQPFRKKQRLAALDALDAIRHADLSLSEKHGMPRRFDTAEAEESGTGQSRPAISIRLATRPTVWRSGHPKRSFRIRPIVGKTNRRAFDPPDQTLILLMPGLFSDPHSLPMRKNRKMRKVVDMTIHTLRNMVERCVSKLKNGRRLATRYAKTADSLLGFIDIACIRLWLRHSST